MSAYLPVPQARPHQTPVSVSAAGDTDIVIGLINIMPPGAMKTAETLFRHRLNAFSTPCKIHWRLFALDRSSDPAAKTSAAPQYYEGLDALWESPNSGRKPDALIVTGTESKARLMTDEACWPDLQKICDWAGENTISTLWSCFSAHAAVLHMDNIHREPFFEKLSGIFECEKTADHPIFQNMPAQWSVPHSRYNNLNEAGLVANGYEILSRASGFGADSFTKQYINSQFLFLQGHPEYATATLSSEYFRDLKRFAHGQSSRSPRPPQNYFDESSLAIFDAGLLPDALSSAEFGAAVTARLANAWDAPAQQLFAGWLSYIAERKTDIRTQSYSRLN
jgi:homoserine O-succinyltransferase